MAKVIVRKGGIKEERPVPAPSVDAYRKLVAAERTRRWKVSQVERMGRILKKVGMKEVPCDLSYEDAELLFRFYRKKAVKYLPSSQRSAEVRKILERRGIKINALIGVKW